MYGGGLAGWLVVLVFVFEIGPCYVVHTGPQSQHPLYSELQIAAITPSTMVNFSEKEILLVVFSHLFRMYMCMWEGGGKEEEEDGEATAHVWGSGDILRFSPSNTWVPGVKLQMSGSQQVPLPDEPTHWPWERIPFRSLSSHWDELRNFYYIISEWWSLRATKHYVILHSTLRDRHRPPPGCWNLFTHYWFWTPTRNCYCSGWSALVTKMAFFSNLISAAFSPTKTNSITQSKNKETQNSISAHVPFCHVRATGLHGVTLPHRHLVPTSQPYFMDDSYTFQMLVF